MSKETQPKTISAIWDQNEKEVTEANKARALKSLQREAEIAVADLGNKSEDADNALTDAIRGALKGADKVANLFELKRATKIAKAKHTDAIADYEEFFGTKPTLQ